MIRTIVYVLIAVVAVVAVFGSFHVARVKIRNKKEMDKYQTAETYRNKLGRTLVVYYSLSGKTEAIAKQIQTITKADIYQIKTVETFKTSPAFYASIRSQLKNKQYPEIQKNMPDFSKYDTIFVGSPIWWYTAATPVYSFLQKANFAGKRVVPFSTQGSNYGTFFEDFKANAKNAKIAEGASFNNVSTDYDEAVRNKIIVWLNGVK